MVCEVKGIESTSAGLAIAEEECLMQLPVAGPATPSTGILTLTAQPLAGETVTVGATVLSFTAGAPGANQVQIGANAAATATALATAIDGLAPVTASAVGSVVTVTAAAAGASGNTIALDSNSGSIQESGLTLTGGKDLNTGPNWREREANEYSDFGGEDTKTARNPINKGRKRKKGTVVSTSASGGWNEDFTMNNMSWLLQGFLFADALELPSTAPLNVAPMTLTATTANTFQAAGGLGVFGAGDLIVAKGFPNDAQNGLHLATGAASGSVTVSSVLPAIAGPFPGAKLSVVGRQFAAGDIAVVLEGNVATLTATAADFTTVKGLRPGAWVYVGGDAITSRFDNNMGLARVSAVAAKKLTLDQTTWAPQDESGAGKSLRLFTSVQVSDAANDTDIKRRSYTLRRTLGEGEFGEQAEYVIGSVANELTLNVPDADKLNVDLTFMGCDHIVRSGAVGDELLPGTETPAGDEDAVNTSTDLIHNKLYIHDNARSSPRPLFAYVEEADVSINNNASGDRALGQRGAFDVSVANLEASGSLTAYFQSVNAIRAMRSNADVGWFMAFALKNEGFLIDMPLLGFSGGMAEIELGSKIKLPLEGDVSENKFGTQFSYSKFDYLPTVAMPSV